MNLVLQAGLMITDSMEPPVAKMCWQVTSRVDSSTSVLSTLQQVVGPANYVYIYIYINIEMFMPEFFTSQSRNYVIKSKHMISFNIRDIARCILSIALLCQP